MAEDLLVAVLTMKNTFKQVLQVIHEGLYH